MADETGVASSKTWANVPWAYYLFCVLLCGVIGGGIWVLYRWLHSSPDYTIRIEDKPIFQVLNLDCFHGTSPAMTKPEILGILGPTENYSLKTENVGDDEYKEERWQWGVTGGILSYYCEPTTNGGDGSLEFTPNSLDVGRSFLRPYNLAFSKPEKTYLVACVRGKTHLMDIRIRNGKITLMNWYNE